jgi:hypothetical protein
LQQTGHHFVQPAQLAFKPLVTLCPHSLVSPISAPLRDALSQQTCAKLAVTAFDLYRLTLFLKHLGQQGAAPHRGRFNHLRGWHGSAGHLTYPPRDPPAGAPITAPPN